MKRTNKLPNPSLLLQKDFHLKSGWPNAHEKNLSLQHHLKKLPRTEGSSSSSVPEARLLRGPVEIQAWGCKRERAEKDEGKGRIGNRQHLPPPDLPHPVPWEVREGGSAPKRTKGSPFCIQVDVSRPTPSRGTTRGAGSHAYLSLLGKGSPCP